MRINYTEQERIIWKPIIGYEGYYQVNTLGEIRSVERTIMVRKYPRKLKGRIIKSRINRYGYLKIGLSKLSKSKTFEVHRLVALTFLPQQEGRNCVNHLDADKLNNSVENLEWVTPTENVHHAITLNLYSVCKMVINQCTGKLYHSISEASRSESICYSKLKRVFKENGTINCLKLVA